MTAVFVDTSALYALLDSDDQKHRAAKRAFDELASIEQHLMSSSYVFVETYALLHRGIGPEAVESMRDDIAPLVDVVWVDRTIHEAGLDILLQSKKRKLSLVDCVSFEVMRRQSITMAFAYDKHFSEHGFDLL